MFLIISGNDLYLAELRRHPYLTSVEGLSVHRFGLKVFQPPHVSAAAGKKTTSLVNKRNK